MRVDPENLTKAIQDALREYADVTEDAAFDGVLQTADMCVSELQAASPPGSGKYGSWSKYNKSWSRMLGKSKGVSYAIIHNKKYYRLAHLLENGHALRGGGHARAFPHIAPVAEKAEEQLLNNIKKHIQ